MARGRPAGSDGGGGESIQAPRPGPARLATGLLAFGTGIGLAVYPVLQDLHLRWVAVGLGGLALALLALGLATRSGRVLGCALVALGGEYAVLFSAEGRALDEVTPFYAGALFLVAELAFWSIERRVPAWNDRGLAELRLAYVVGASAGAAVVAALVLVAAAAAGGGGVGLEALGVAATIGALVLVAALIRMSAPEVDST